MIVGGDYDVDLFVLKRGLVDMMGEDWEVSFVSDSGLDKEKITDDLTLVPESLKEEIDLERYDNVVLVPNKFIHKLDFPAIRQLIHKRKLKVV